MAEPPELSPENNWKEVNHNQWIFQLPFLSNRNITDVDVTDLKLRTCRLLAS